MNKFAVYLLPGLIFPVVFGYVLWEGSHAEGWGGFVYGGALWLLHGNSSTPPEKIDRKTGVARTIGRNGAGPNEYIITFAMTAGPRGEVGIWDSNRRLWFWVDSAGVQRRTWPVSTTRISSQVFADVHGNVYLGQPGTLRSSCVDSHVLVRLDSAGGFRDTTEIPFRTPAGSTWLNTTSAGCNAMGVPHASHALWGVDTRGRMYAAWNDSSFVVVRDGQVYRRQSLPDIRESLSPVERKEANDMLDRFELDAKKRRAQFAGPRPSIPGTRSQIDRLTSEMNGGVAVSRSMLCTSIPEWRSPGSRAPAAASQLRCPFVERFDTEGRRLVPFTLSPGDRLLVLRADTAWVSREDRDGLQQIVEMVLQAR